METKDIILELRTQNGLSQDELAEKTFVTRQAVSRWGKWGHRTEHRNTEAIIKAVRCFNQYAFRFSPKTDLPMLWDAAG